MGFFTERCPNCGANNSKQAQFCNSCGCPAAGSWATCASCGASVGSESKFCWRCGSEQKPDLRRAFYGDRWHRSPIDFAARIDLCTPETTLHHGLLVDEGTLALLFQDGHFKGTLEAGYHTFDNFLQRLVGLDKGRAAHAVLLDIRSAEIDLAVSDVRTENHIPVDVRIRLLFQVFDPRLFVQTFFGDGATTFTTEDLTNRYLPYVREAMQIVLAKTRVDDLLCEFHAREIVEGELLSHLEPILVAEGVHITGVRMAEFVGPAIDDVRQKLGELNRVQREADLNRRLQDALREEKVAAFRDEQQLDDCYQRVVHEMGFHAAEREEERKKFIQSSEHRTQIEGIRQDYERRRSEILNRLDEQKLLHERDFAEARAELDRRALRFAVEMQEQEVRLAAARKAQIEQGDVDLQVAIKGVEALKAVQAAKLEAKRKEEEIKIEVERELIKLRGDAPLQALLATVPVEQADRLLKLAELQMRQGLSPEQALALVAERSPELAPVIAEALKAKYASGH